MFRSVLLIAAGASAGALIRWLLGLWLNPLLRHFAFGTLAANILGCLLAGILLAAGLKQPLPDSLKLLLITGFLGSLTTFSAFSTEFVQAAAAHKWGSAAWMFTLHSVGGIAAVFCGLILTAKILD